MKKDLFDQFLEEINREQIESDEEIFVEDMFGLTDEIDHEILMHRDVHFSGNFEIMLEYYEKDGKGVCPEFSITQIKNLIEQENAFGTNIAPMILSGAEMEKIAVAKKAYQVLKEIYDLTKTKDEQPKLIANLILSENDEPTKEIKAIVKMEQGIVPHLIKILKTENLYDPLFPGYGTAPFLAAKCLGQIGDESAIIPLFESIGRGDCLSEREIIDAIKHIGDSAKKFLMQVVNSHPITEGNERAALALSSFSKDKDVQKLCRQLLKQNPEENLFTDYLKTIVEDF